MVPARLTTFCCHCHSPVAIHFSNRRSFTDQFNQHGIALLVRLQTSSFQRSNTNNRNETWMTGWTKHYSAMHCARKLPWGAGSLRDAEPLSPVIFFYYYEDHYSDIMSSWCNHLFSYYLVSLLTVIGWGCIASSLHSFVTINSCRLHITSK